MRPITMAALAAVLVSALAAMSAGPAAAQSTARVSGDVTAYASPGNISRPVARLANGTNVHLDQCTTPSSEDEWGRRYADWAGESWCYVSEAGGWVNANVLVGAAAKINATPPVSLTTPSRRFPLHD